jgi:hypothetical protein
MRLNDKVKAIDGSEPLRIFDTRFDLGLQRFRRCHLLPGAAMGLSTHLAFFLALHFFLSIGKRFSYSVYQKANPTTLIAASPEAIQQCQHAPLMRCFRIEPAPRSRISTFHWPVKTWLLTMASVATPSHAVPIHSPTSQGRRSHGNRQ